MSAFESESQLVKELRLCLNDPDYMKQSLRSYWEADGETDAAGKLKSG